MLKMSLGVMYVVCSARRLLGYSTLLHALSGSAGRLALLHAQQQRVALHRPRLGVVQLVLEARLQAYVRCSRSAKEGRGSGREALEAGGVATHSHVQRTAWPQLVHTTTSWRTEDGADQ